MKTLRDALASADQERRAIGHFNVSELTALNAVVTSARELSGPVIVGVSEGEREFIGIRQIVALIRSFRDEFGLPIFLNADHTYSLKKAEEAARAGFDEILFDRSELAFDQNVAETRKAVEAIKSIDPSIVIEGEIGFIGSSSAIHDKAPDSSRILSTPQEAAQFVEATKVDVLAPAVGTMHGMLRQMVQGSAEKHLDVPRIAAIKQAVRIPLTLHGGSGTNSGDFRNAIKAGLTIIHINTELRLAWRRGMEEALASHPNDIAPYKILPTVVDRIQEVVCSHIQLFNSL
jgi:fructose-bisphosphate aldolase class II